MSVKLLPLVEIFSVNAYNFKVMLEPDEESRGYVISCPSLPGCYSQCETIDEAITNIKEAILLCLEDMQEHNEEIRDSSKTLLGSVVVTL